MDFDGQADPGVGVKGAGAEKDGRVSPNGRPPADRRGLGWAGRDIDEGVDPRCPVAVGDGDPARTDPADEVLVLEGPD